tara:strand:- start:214 stop:1143 length:930 start_codon:yes stop_codon:yes gene_type:complete
MRNKKGIAALTLIVIVGLVIGFVAVGGLTGVGKLLAASPTDTTTQSAVKLTKAQCQVEDVSARYNDQNFYAKGTDPAGSLVILSGSVPPQKIQDDGTLTVSTFADIVGYANATNYFGVPVKVNTDCKDPFDVSPIMKQAGVPTITIVNDDGATVNTDANDEAMGASATFTSTVTVRAPNDQCAWGDNGAIIAVEYDATNFQKFTSDLSTSSDAILVTHNSSGETAQSATLDQWKTFKVDKALCDNAKLEFVINTETTSTQPTEDLNPVIWVLPNNLDRDESTFALINGIYDEDNNYIGLTQHNKTLFVS